MYLFNAERKAFEAIYREEQRRIDPPDFEDSDFDRELAFDVHIDNMVTEDRLTLRMCT